MSLTALVVLSAVAYRVTRFTQLDSLIENSRDRLALWLRVRADDTTGWKAAAYRKALDGMLCAFCVSVWVAAGAVIFYAAATPYQLDWESVLHWLAVSAGAMVFYRYIDPPE